MMKPDFHCGLSAIKATIEINDAYADFLFGKFGWMKADRWRRVCDALLMSMDVPRKPSPKKISDMYSALSATNGWREADRVANECADCNGTGYVVLYFRARSSKNVYTGTACCPRCAPYRDKKAASDFGLHCDLISREEYDAEIGAQAGANRRGCATGSVTTPTAVARRESAGVVGRASVEPCGSGARGIAGASVPVGRDSATGGGANKPPWEDDEEEV